MGVSNVERAVRDIELVTEKVPLDTDVSHDFKIKPTVMSDASTKKPVIEKEIMKKGDFSNLNFLASDGMRSFTTKTQSNRLKSATPCGLGSSKENQKAQKVVFGDNIEVSVYSKVNGYCCNSDSDIRR
ncbi:hypothetical protein Tco_0062361 [Tanacetum coccineum]